MTAQNLFTIKWCAVAAMAVIAASCHTTKPTTAATSASMQWNEVRLDSAKTDEELEIELDEWYFYHDTLPLPWHRTDSSATTAPMPATAAVRHLAVKRKATAASGSVKGAATVKEQVAEKSSQATACGICRIVLAAAAVVAIVATIIIARLKMWNN